MVKPYGLKQGTCMWYYKFDSYVLSFMFERYKSYHDIYFKYDVDCFLIIATYIDDLSFIRKLKILSSILQSQLLVKFKMKDLGW